MGGWPDVEILGIRKSGVKPLLSSPFSFPFPLAAGGRNLCKGSSFPKFEPGEGDLFLFFFRPPAVVVVLLSSSLFFFPPPLDTHAGSEVRVDDDVAFFLRHSAGFFPFFSFPLPFFSSLRAVDRSAGFFSFFLFSFL